MISIETDNKIIENKFYAALNKLESNCVKVDKYPEKVLIEGNIYPGIWHECGPMENVFYGAVNDQVPFHGINIFYDYQREDGMLPTYVWIQGGNWEPGAGFTQVQMVVPIASSALDLFYLSGDKDILEKTFSACTKFDNWLTEKRDRKKKGVVDLFCEFDTGHDNSKRFVNVPKLSSDANYLESDNSELPYIAPDLTATRYGMRKSLSEIASVLNMPKEAEFWDKKAEETKKALYEECFDSETKLFFDRKNNGEFNKIICDTLSRVCCEHIPTQEEFEYLFNTYIYNPKHFWAEYPLSSVSLSDERLDDTFPLNSWGGASQALTALRSSRWFDFYGKTTEHRLMMEKWIKAINNSPDFMQQINPFTGEMTTGSDYSPCLLVYIDFISRLYGIVNTGKEIIFNSYLPNGANYFNFEYDSFGVKAKIETNKKGSVIYYRDKIINIDLNQRYVLKIL